MASVNKVIVLGNCGRDPEMRTLPNGDAVCNVSVATTRSWKDKNSGDKMEETEWHRLSFFGRVAEIAGEYLKKGSPVYVEGRLKTRKWQDNDGVDRYTTEIIVDSMQLLGSRRDGDDDDGQDDRRDTRQQQRQAPARSSQQQRPAQRSSGGYGSQQRTGTGFDDMDDDIPF